MTKKNLQIHSENILPIIKKWLYSDKNIFVRELVSNACDAIHKLQIMRDRGETDITDEEFRIDISIDKENQTLKFADLELGWMPMKWNATLLKLLFPVQKILLKSTKRIKKVTKL